MAIDAFLQFTEKGTATDIKGETQDSFFSKPPKGPAAFELSNWSFSTTNQSNIGSATQGAGAGKASFDPFKVTKIIDRATPYLFYTCCVGGHYDMVTLWVRKPGADSKTGGKPYLQWEFRMVFIQEIAWSHADPAPTEEITFVYGAIHFSYYAQDKQGQLSGTPQESRWSQVLNNDTDKVDL
jgi:type VI secretion system secreted protein Hcp